MHLGLESPEEGRSPLEEELEGDVWILLGAAVVLGHAPRRQRRQHLPLLQTTKANGDF